MRVSIQPAQIADAPWVLRELTPVPDPATNVCPNCHTWKAADERWCENCEEVQIVLDTPPLSASFVTLYAKPSRLRDWLTHYKGRPDDQEPWEQEAEDIVEAIVARFITEHGSRVAEAVGAVDLVIVVPSTNRPAPHPLELLLDRVGLDVPVSRGLHRTAEPIGFRKPNARAYQADDTVGGRHVFLMDDVYTTGAHLNSAAAALRRAGAEVAGALVLARRVNPGYRSEIRDLWDAANRSLFNWKTSPYIPPAAR